MSDPFFTKEKCDRCGKSLQLGRTMSWFTEDCICMECSMDEGILRNKLPNRGRDLEGCGYVPDPSKDMLKE